ncbi:hypothetical protein [uncultured Corynebacterium sp.]|uniref:hypothetical protein n=1 Tax=uncultured Corynebacterium sp. TaxID=159447 RepID=UPI00259B3533|nr:hypothetical protein [uncultured Corynebacterium sp.]
MTQQPHETPNNPPLEIPEERRHLPAPSEPTPQNGGWWKWLLGILVFLLLAWLLWSLFAGGQSEEEFNNNQSSVTATETVDITTTMTEDTTETVEPATETNTDASEPTVPEEVTTTVNLDEVLSDAPESETAPAQ